MAIYVLPEDLVVNVLSWLPVKSLMRFKCVCKSWSSIFETPSFIAKHLNNNSNTTDIGGRGRLFFSRVDWDSRQYLYSILSDETLEVIADLDFPYLKDDRVHNIGLVIAGCCDGIICAHDTVDVGIVLWNPATRELKILPKSDIPRPKDMSEYPGATVFGFDASRNQYKVVRLVNLNHIMVRSLSCQIEVYELSTDSWRKSNAVMPPVGFNSFASPAPFINNYFYWLAEDVCCGREIVLSFEISQEVFKTTPVPPHVCGGISKKLHFSAILTVFHESIALINRPEPDGGMDDMIEVWMLNEHGVKDSWTKLYSLGPFLQVRRPIGYWKDKRLVVETTSGLLALLDMVTLEVKDLHFDHLRLSSVVSYNESLIPLNGISCSDSRVPRKLPPELAFLTW